MMTDDDREKFDAIRMNLELLSHDLESMRGRDEAVRVQMQERDEAARVQMQELTAQMRESRIHMQESRIKTDSLRESVRDLMVISSQLIASVQSHEGRIRAVEGRT